LHNGGGVPDVTGVVVAVPAPKDFRRGQAIIGTGEIITTAVGGAEMIQRNEKSILLP
jgi:hypothetical protein